MWPGIELISNNLGIGLEYLILIIVTLAGLIFFAIDWKVGLVIEFLSSGLLFMWFYNDASLDWAPALIAMFLWLVIMSLTLYSISKTGVSRGQVT